MKLYARMDRTLPPKVMIQGIEEIQLFLAQDPEGNKELSDVTLIHQFALIKLGKTGIYAKFINIGMQRMQRTKLCGEYSSNTSLPNTNKCSAKVEVPRLTRKVVAQHTVLSRRMATTQWSRASYSTRKEPPLPNRKSLPSRNASWPLN